MESASLAKLATLPIKGRAPRSGYDRSLFGDAWTDDVTVDLGHNGGDKTSDSLGVPACCVRLGLAAS